MKFYRPNIIRRFRILDHTDTSSSLKVTARKFKVQTKILGWRQFRAIIEARINENLSANIFCCGTTAKTQTSKTHA